MINLNDPEIAEDFYSTIYDLAMLRTAGQAAGSTMATPGIREARRLLQHATLELEAHLRYYEGSENEPGERTHLPVVEGDYTTPHCDAEARGPDLQWARHMDVSSCRDCVRAYLADPPKTPGNT